MSSALCTWDASPQAPVDGYNVYLKKDGGEFVKANSALISELEFKLTNLSPGSYQAYETAVKGEDESAPSNIVSFTIEFDTKYKPAGLSATVVNAFAGDVDFEWDYVPGITQYNMYLEVEGSYVKQNENPLYSNQISLSGLGEGTYNWKVSSVYDGSEIESDVASFTFTVSSVTGFSATPDGSDVDFTWDAYSGADSYNVYIDDGTGFAKANASAITGTTFTETGLADGSYDAYVVAVIDGVEGGQSSTTSFTIGTASETTYSYRYYRAVIYRLNGGNSFTGTTEFEMYDTEGGSRVTGSGTASASDENSSYPATKAFDGLRTEGDGWVVPWSGSLEWVQYDFGSAQDVVQWGFGTYPTSTATIFRSAEVLILEGSDDGSTWVQIDGRNLEGVWASDYEFLKFKFSDTGVLVSTDFSEYPNDGTQPSDWSVFGSGGNWEVGTDGSDDYLITDGNTNDPALITNDIDHANDTEIVIEFETSVNDADIRVGTISRAGGATEYNFILVQWHGESDELQVYEVEKGGSNLLTDISFPISLNTKYKIKTRVEGTSIKTKMWASTDPEPGSWDINTTFFDDYLMCGGGVGVKARNSTAGEVKIHSFETEVIR